MMEDTSKQEAPEGEEDAEEGEPEEGHEEGQHGEEPRAQAEPHRDPPSGGGGWLSKLIWLVILALIVWGGWTAYKRGNANAPETSPGESAPAAPATTTP